MMNTQSVIPISSYSRLSPAYGERYQSLKLAPELTVAEDFVDPLQSRSRGFVSQSDTKSAAPLPVNAGGDHLQKMESQGDKTNLQAADVSTSECMQKGVDGAAQRVVVILDASKESHSSALKWALEGFGFNPGDVFTLLGVLHQVNTPSTSSLVRIKAGPRLLGHTTRADANSIFGWNTGIIEEEVTKKKDEYLKDADIQHIREQCEKKKVQFDIVVRAGFPAKVVAVATAIDLRATWIILDRQIKDEKYFLENLSCGISRVKRNNYLEVLRGNLGIPKLYSEDHLDQDLFSLDISTTNAKKPPMNSYRASTSSGTVSESEDAVSNPTAEAQWGHFLRPILSMTSPSVLLHSHDFEAEPGAKLSISQHNSGANIAHIPSHDSNSPKSKTRPSSKIPRSRSDSSILDTTILANLHGDHKLIRSKADGFSMARDKHQQNAIKMDLDLKAERKSLHPENEGKAKNKSKLFSIGEEIRTYSYRRSPRSDIFKSETKIIVEDTEANSKSKNSASSVSIPKDDQEITSSSGTVPTPSVSSGSLISLKFISEENVRYPTCSVCKYKSPDFGREIRRFTWEELRLATDNFSPENFLSEGGFGAVYRGQLEEGQYIAVKQHKVASSQGEREFRSEVEFLSRAHHRNLVMLLGYCSEDNHRLLVYEFVCNGSLDKHVSRRSAKPLEWRYRMKIAKGAARGLRYLHDECRGGCIVHRDMRPNNILVTHDFEPMLGDFGLARSQNDGSDTVCDTRIVGTLGYLPPEYAESGKVSTKTDVYSFGVVLLELITGRKALDNTLPAGQQSLVPWARPLVDDRRYHDLIDPRIVNAHDVHQLYCMVRAAGLCLRKDPAKRPSMNQVVQILESDDSLRHSVEEPESPAAIRSDQFAEINPSETTEGDISGNRGQFCEPEGSPGTEKSPHGTKVKHPLCYADMLT